MPNPGSRKSDYWYSRNKVLGLSHVAGRKPHARNPNFDTEETKLLISLWGDPKVQKTLITTHKKSPVIEKLAQTMRERGYYRSPEEINTRLKNLKCIYNRIKKDLEIGILTETSWKHYENMEEILNRPIFGRDAAQERVRQQEIHFKQELEKANNEKALISTDSLAFLKDFIDEGDTDDDDDDEFGDDEADLDEEEYDPEMTTDESSVDSKQRNKSEISKKIEKKQETTEIKTEEPLIVPKEEPIDVDDPEMVVQQPETRKPPSEPQYKIKIAAVSAAPTSTTNKITITSQPQPTLKFTQAQYVMSTPTTTNATAGKISLVPTNILLKPQTQQPTTNLTFKPQQFLYTKGPNQAGTLQTQMSNMTMPITSGTVTSNTGMPMKLLLVNRVPQNLNQAKDGNLQTQSIIQAKTTAAHTIAHTTTPSASAQVITTSATIKSITPAQSMPQQARLRMMDGIRKPVPNLKSSKSHLPGFRTLLHQIANMEQQNLEINRQRLEMEKRRFEFEKSMAEKFLAILPSIQFNHSHNNNNSNSNSSNTNNINPNDFGSTSTNGDGGIADDVVDNEIFCLSPKKELIEDD